VVRQQIANPDELVLNRFYSVTRDEWEGNEMIVVTTPAEMQSLLVRFERRPLWLPSPDRAGTYELLADLPECPSAAVHLEGRRVSWPRGLDLALDDVAA